MYILASKKDGVLYVGVTNNLKRRTMEHKTEVFDGFTKKYFIHRLVYFEKYKSINDAIQREKRIKKWNREWKIKLIEENNPEWKDISIEM